MKRLKNDESRDPTPGFRLNRNRLWRACGCRHQTRAFCAWANACQVLQGHTWKDEDVLKPDRSPCHRLTFEEAVQVHLRLFAGEMYSRIAATYDINQGRIADVKFGRLHPTSYEEAVRRSGR